MSKMSKLAAELAELKHCGEILIGISETLTQMFSSDARQDKQEQIKEPKDKQEKALTLTDVRKVLAEKSRNGHTAQVKELLIKYGADKLSEIDPSKYAELLAEVEVL
ncbi:MAG: hypothetical protein GX453_03295 [Lactococcus chungangensis]|uniref:DNA ligase n=1 Tax=Pseudolactococcus chungangensis TaxID=451457 RepID=A0A847IZY4_9LACT|nr:hypothetical protein [Lactococcus chungangensis]